MLNTQRTRLVNTSAGMIRCPRHINRVDPSNGWQIRFDRPDEPYYSKFFADNQYGGLFGSLRAASDHLQHIQKLYRTTDQCHLPKSEYIRFNWHLRSRSDNPDGILQLDCQVHICSWQRKKRTKSFYVGTETTVNQQRIDRVKSHARKVMEWRNRFIEQHGRERLMTADLPESLSAITPPHIG